MLSIFYTMCETFIANDGNFSASQLNHHRVCTGFGKFWKLKITFCRTWNVFEKGGFFKMAVEKFLNFCYMLAGIVSLAR